MAKHPQITDDDATQSTGRNSQLTRRSYVRSLAAVATATVGAAAAGTTAADEDFETITIDGGEDRTITLESGETLENTVFDCTASGARVTVIAKGTNWTIRNVAVEGHLDVGTPNTVFGVADTGGNTSTIENLYLGDGAADAGKPTAETGIWVDPEHSGHLDIRRANIQGFSDNAIYASAPGGKGGGTVHIDECYAANCRTSHYRIGSAGSKVTNSNVSISEDGFDGRAVWVRTPGPCTVENCQLETNGRNYAVQAGAHDGGATVTVTDTDYDTGFHEGIGRTNGGDVQLEDDVGTDPEAFVPEPVPQSPAEAAAESDR